MVILPAVRVIKGVLIGRGITKTKGWKGLVFINPQHKSAPSGYRDQVIVIIFVSNTSSE